MAINGTRAHEVDGRLPPLVHAAVAVAVRRNFAFSCLPSHGRLLQVLAAGVGSGSIGETGTGCGVGLAWLASGARPEAQLVSIERDAELAALAQELFAEVPAVTVVHGDWSQLRRYGPFDLLALDGGGQGKGCEPPLEPAGWLNQGGVVVLDDFIPMTDWPPTYGGHVDRARLHWLRHPNLLAAEIRTEPGAATVIASFTG